MIPAVSMWSFDRAVSSGLMSQKKFIQWAHENDLSNVELLSYYMDKEENLKQCISILSDLKMKVSCYTILSDFSQPGFSQSQGFLNDLENAEKLRAPYVRILAGGSKTGDSSEREIIVNGIGSAVKEAENRGITLVLENIGPAAGSAIESLSILKDVDSPYLRMNFDTANPLLVGEDPLDAFSVLVEYTSYVHLKDFITDREPRFSMIADRDRDRLQQSRTGRKMTGVRAGEGIIPLEEIIRKLHKRGYNGIISVEYEGTGDSSGATEASLNYLCSLL